jgi:hypothetical protein
MKLMEAETGDVYTVQSYLSTDGLLAVGGLRRRVLLALLPTPRHNTEDQSRVLAAKAYEKR